MLALLTMGVVALALAWVTSQISPAWANRYLSVLLGPLLLLGAAGLSRAGTLGLVVVAILAVFWFNPRTRALETKSNAHTAAVLVADRLAPGDLVVAIHPEQGPVMHLYLPKGLRWANAMGPVADPRIMDWRDALDRLKEAKPTPTEDALVRTLKPNQRLLAVFPIIRSAQWGAPWTSACARAPPSGSGCSTATSASRACWRRRISTAAGRRACGRPLPAPLAPLRNVSDD